MQIDFNALVNGFARGQRLAIQLSRQGERDAAEETETPDPGCRYCGQDFCVCGKRYGSVQGIVSRREAGRKA